MNRSHGLYRREFLQVSASAVGAMFGGGLAAGIVAQAPAAPAPRKMRILILGGTGFIGPWMAELAVSRGHQVTLFNRGRREKYIGATDGTEKLYGNRDPRLHAQTKIVDGKEVEDETSPRGLSELDGKTWDAVIDNSGYVPRIVGASAELLAPNVGQYLYISTLSVYADNSQAGRDETDPLATMDDPTSEDVGRFYGPLKALCEQAAEKAMPGRVTVLRPGYIVGPGDTTDRFTYWPVRVSRGGEVLVPGSAEDPVQFIDVRDLVAFAIHCVENHLVGIFNATGPERKLTVGELMAACLSAAKGVGSQGDAAFTYMPYDWLDSKGCPIGTLPILLPNEGETAGFHQRSVAKGVGAGLTCRSTEETCRALLEWWPTALDLRAKVAKEVNEERKANGLAPAPAAPEGLRAGIPPEAEAKLLAQWRGERNGEA